MKWVERTCLNCGETFYWPRKFFCSYACGVKFNRRRGRPYNEEDDADILQWIKDNAKTREEYEELYGYFFGDNGGAK